MPRPYTEYLFGEPKTPVDPPGAAITELQRSVGEIAQEDRARLFMSVKTKSASYTMDSLTDRVILAAGGTMLITLPFAADADHVEYVVKSISGTVTVDTKASDGTVDGTDINATPISLTIQKSIRVVSDGTNWHRTDIDN